MSLFRFEYSWAIAIVAAFLMGSVATGIVVRRKGVASTAAAKVQLITTLVILAVFIHSLYWENENFEIHARGWLLLITFPCFFICFMLSGIISLRLWVLSYRRRPQA